MKAKGRTSDIDVKIGQNLKFLRLMHNYSQAELASELDISFQQLQKYEKGKNRVSVSRLLQISEIFNISMLEFLSGVVDKNSTAISSSSISLNIDPENQNKHIPIIISKLLKLKNPKKISVIFDLMDVMLDDDG